MCGGRSSLSALDLSEYILWELHEVQEGLDGDSDYLLRSLYVLQS